MEGGVEGGTCRNKIKGRRGGRREWKDQSDIHVHG